VENASRPGGGSNGIDDDALHEFDAKFEIIICASAALESDCHRPRKAGACGFLVEIQPREDIILANLDAHTIESQPFPWGRWASAESRCLMNSAAD